MSKQFLDYDKGAALIAAARVGDHATLGALLASGSFLPKGQARHLALCVAARLGHGQCIELLISEGDPTLEDSRALRLAAKHGFAECVRLLIPVSNPKVNDSQALLLAAEDGHVECVKALIPFSDPLSTHSAPLFKATERGHADVVAAILFHDPTLLALLMPCLSDARSAHAFFQHPEVAAVVASAIERQALGNAISAGKHSHSSLGPQRL